MTRKQLGSKILGTICSYLDWLDFAIVRDMYPESTAVWHVATAFENINEEKLSMYTVNRKLHRLGNLPALTHKDGTKTWAVNGKLHRTDGPALVHPNGGKEWYQNDLCHRTDGPAVIWPYDGREEWWQDGELHRTDGPAATFMSGPVYAIRGEQMSKADFDNVGTAVTRYAISRKRLGKNLVGAICSYLDWLDFAVVRTMYPESTAVWHRSTKFESGVSIREYICWRVNGKRHRLGDLPAVISTRDHSRFWCRNGKLHRDGDRPAATCTVLWTDEWWKNGKLHRINGPAVVSYIGMYMCLWYRNGIYYGGGGIRWHDRGAKKLKHLDFNNCFADY